MNLSGLDPAGVEESRRLHGSNLIKVSRWNRWRVIADIFVEPMFFLLVIACTIYFFTGSAKEGFIMAFAIIAVAGISIFQEVRSRNALRALRSMIQPKSVVIRGGKEQFILSSDVVVGDLLVLSEGQQVTADAELLVGNDFSVSESVLTGESLPVSKSEQGEQVFSGTTVTSGRAITKVTSVGPNTRIGKLGLSMEEMKQEKTMLQHQIAVFVRRMALFGIAAFGVVWFLHYLQTRDLLHSLFHGLTLAMAVIPEEIPVAVSTFMALGAYRMIRKQVLTRQPQTVEALGAATVLCVDKTGTLTSNSMSVAGLYSFRDDFTFSGSGPANGDHLKELLLYGRLASEPVPFDPMEKAIDVTAKSSGIDIDSFKLIKEYPLSGRFPIMTHVYSTSKELTFITCKGAPEGILPGSGLDPEQLFKVERCVRSFATKGYRVLAVAKGILPDSGIFPEEQQHFKWELIGLIAFSDPIKENIPMVVNAFHEAGIEVKMITGDYPQTACQIAREAGIRKPDKFLTGEQVNAMTGDELSAMIGEINVFARSMPETKLKIIEVLKARGEVVAMTGDGVNDGPALKAAHIGISMGKRGSELARQASSLVLLNDDLGCMVEAVSMGRRIYANLKKAIRYIISIHIPILSVVLLPLIFGWEFVNIFSPVHVIFLELVMGPTCSIVFENEPVEPGLMKKRPRKFTSTFFTWRELSISFLQGVVITTGLMIVIYYSMHSGLSEGTARTLVFTTLIFGNVLLTLSSRSTDYSMLTTLRYNNKLITFVILITLVFLGFQLFIPSLRQVFGFEVISPGMIIACFVLASISVLWIEGYKKSRLLVSKA